MCGPADFDALYTSCVRLAELSAMGITGAAIYKANSLFHELCSKDELKEEQSVVEPAS